MQIDNKDYPRRLHYIGSILWPSFLTACVGTMVFFAMFDPEQLNQITTWPIELSRQWAYTLGFFLFWLLNFFSSLLTWLLLVHDNRQMQPHEQ